MKVVFIGANPQVAEMAGLSICLRWPGVTPLVAAGASDGLGLVETASPDVVILQSYLGDMSMSRALQQLRSFSNVPLMVLGQNPDEAEVVTALEMGADDYVRMPCDPAEIMARVWALLRRVAAKAYGDEQRRVRAGEFFINPSTYEVCSVESHAASESTLSADDLTNQGLAEKIRQTGRQKLTDSAQKSFWRVSGYGIGYHRDWAVHPPIQNP